jgi:hypothetical protein
LLNDVTQLVVRKNQKLTEKYFEKHSKNESHLIVVVLSRIGALARNVLSNKVKFFFY